MFDSWDSELCHHGVKGQKWGRRQYQNEDGSLTTLGEEHYGRNKRDKRAAKDRAFGGSLIERGNRIRLTDSDRKNGLGSRDLKEERVAYYKDLRAKLKQRKDPASKKALVRVTKKLKAQEAANEARDVYDNNASVAKLWVQNKLLGHAKSERYRDARARGSGRARSFVEAVLDGTITGTLMRRSGSRKAYGASVKW